MSGKGMATPGSRAPRARAVPRLLLAALGTGYTAGSLRGWGSDQLALVMGPFGLCAAAGAAAVSCFLHARSRHDQFRRVWMLFALASVMLALGHLARGWREVGPQSAVPGHAYVHGFILACAPLAIAALLVLAKRPVTKAGWACLVLDFWLIAASLLTSVWTLVRAQAAEPAGGSVPGFAYPLLGISLASTIVLLHSYRPAVNRTALNTAAGALAVTMVCQAPFLSPLLHDTSHRAGRLVDAGWFAGCLLLAYAPWSASGQRPPAGRRSQRPAVPGLSAAAPPYAAADWRQPAPQRTTGSLAALAPYLAAAVCTLGILYT
ncbi:phosphodiesterase, partial [Streptomyces sp. NPDC059900]